MISKLIKLGIAKRIFSAIFRMFSKRGSAGPRTHSRPAGHHV